MTTKNILRFFQLIQNDLSEPDQETVLNEFFHSSEIKKLETRLEILKLHNQGKTQREISEQLKCSVTTVSRAVVDWKDSEILRKLIFI